MSKPKNYYKNQHKPRAQIFSINYLAQAIVSIIDSNPVKARSNPTILIKGTSKNTSRASRASNLSLIYSLFLVNFCL